MIQCKDIAEHSSDYVNHDLRLLDQFKMWLHIMMCSCCKQYLQQVKITVVTVKTVKPKEQGETRSQKAMLTVLINL